VKHLYILSLLFLIASCSLNSDQEAALSMATKEYIEARNEAILVTYTAYTHPNALKYYLDRGHDAFKNKFRVTTGENAVELRNGNIRHTEVKGNEIQVQYNYAGVNEFSLRRRRGRKISIFALSSDNGKSWHFLDKNDYWNDAIIAPEDRLIKKR
jgi:Tfp pilus assembly protein PilP